MPALAEPWFPTFKADVEWHPTMQPEDFGKSHMEAIGKKWAKFPKAILENDFVRVLVKAHACESVVPGFLHFFIQIIYMPEREMDRMLFK